MTVTIGRAPGTGGFENVQQAKATERELDYDDPRKTYPPTTDEDLKQTPPEPEIIVPEPEQPGVQIAANERLPIPPRLKGGKIPRELLPSPKIFEEPVPNLPPSNPDGLGPFIEEILKDTDKTPAEGLVEKTLELRPPPLPAFRRLKPTVQNRWGSFDIEQFSLYDSEYIYSRFTYSLITGLFFHPTGQKLYGVEVNAQEVREIPLTTAWDITTMAAASTDTFDASGGISTPRVLLFKPDGTKMYIGGHDTLSTDDLDQYDLNPAWDISTASNKTTKSFSGDTNTYGFFWKPDGTALYYSGPGASDNEIWVRTVSTPWDISTIASSATTSAVITSELRHNSAGPMIYFSPDGLKLFVMFNFCDIAETDDYVFVEQRSLSTAWDLDTLGSVEKTLILGTYNEIIDGLTPYGLTFSTGGDKMYFYWAGAGGGPDFDIGYMYEYQQ